MKDKKVLEIGCGSGLVTSHLIKSGALVNAIDITENAISITKKRLYLENLRGNVQLMDAENLDFKDNSVNFVIAWGVIHHSGNMKAIINEIYRVLKPGGKAYLMIYNRNSIRYNIYVKFWLGIVKLKRLKYSNDEIAGQITDGYIARHLTQKEFRVLLNHFKDIKITFSDEKITILKYLFGIGKIFIPFQFITRPLERFLAKRWGWYLEAVVTK